MICVVARRVGTPREKSEKCLEMPVPAVAFLGLRGGAGQGARRRRRSTRTRQPR